MLRFLLFLLLLGRSRLQRTRDNGVCGMHYEWIAPKKAVDRPRKGAREGKNLERQGVAFEGKKAKRFQSGRRVHWPQNYQGKDRGH